MSACPSATVLVPRRRVKFEFWLDLNKAEEAALADWLADLKASRQFLPVLRGVLTTIRQLVNCQVHLVAGVLNRLLQGQSQAVEPSLAPRPNTAQKEITLDIKTGVTGGNGKQANANFLSAMARLQGLDPSVYLSKHVTSTPKEIRRIEGSEIALEVPAFDDDLDLELI